MLGEIWSTQNMHFENFANWIVLPTNDSIGLPTIGYPRVNPHANTVVII